MRWTLITIFAIAIGGLIYVVYILQITGQFKTLHPHFAGQCRALENIPGAEDITISQKGIAYISSDDRRNGKAGSIYRYDLNDLQTSPEKLNLPVTHPDRFHPHGISLYQDEHGLSLFVVNHPAGIDIQGLERPIKDPSVDLNSIEVFALENGSWTLRQSLSDATMLSVNDVYAINHAEFYFTNDHGTANSFRKQLDDYLRISRAQLVFYSGGQYRIEADDLAMANGVNGSPDGRYVYVAETTGRNIRVYERAENGSLALRKSIFAGTGVDNIERTPGGRLWVGAHPALLTFVSHAKDKNQFAPSQVLALHPETGQIEEILLSTGDGLTGGVKDLSASSVAAIWKNRLLLGGVFEARVLDCVMQ